MKNMRHLSVKWSTSRGRDSYGWNICTLTDDLTGKKYRTCGGGAFGDMLGTVFASWMRDVYKQKLLDFANANPEKVRRLSTGVNGYAVTDERYRLYGFDVIAEPGKPAHEISIDGACGLSSMERIAGAIGLHKMWHGTPKGRTQGWTVWEGE